MFFIKEFEEKYNEYVNDFIISIYVDEFDHENSRQELKNHSNIIYTQSGGNMWIAFNKANEIIGTIAIFKHNTSEAEIKKFYVRQDFRGKGVSNELYKTALNFCKANSVKNIFLYTHRYLSSAVSFYLKNRF